MKTKLRKINHNGQNFYYTVSRNYGLPKSGPTLSVRVFLDNFKETPLTIEMDAELIEGENPFFNGVVFNNTISGEKETINANDPKLITRFIVYGKQKGWNGRNAATVIDGLALLGEWGYDNSPPYILAVVG